MAAYGKRGVVRSTVDDKPHIIFKKTVSMEQSNSSNYVIGLVLAILSCFFIGSSFIVKKIGLRRLSSSKSARASEGGYGYLRDWIWWLGLITMGVGEAANFAAYAFAPASLVTPLGALSILVSAVLASKFLNENLNILGKIGCLLCVLGSTVVVIHAPKEADVNSLNELNSKIWESGFVYYVIGVIIVAALTARYVVPRFGNTYVVVYIFICSIIGSLSVMCCKGLGLSIRENMLGSKSILSPAFLIFLVFLCLCICVQMNYLNKALDIFNTAIVNPIHYVFFTSSVILASAILFQEWKHIGGVDILANVVGFIIIILGIFMLSAFKEIRISLLDLYPSRRSRSDFISV